MNAIFYAKLTNLLLDTASYLTGRNDNRNNHMVKTEAEMSLFVVPCKCCAPKNTKRYLSLTGRELLCVMNGHFSNTNRLQFSFTITDVLKR